MWFDKVCINQSNIAADLECLPIFLAGCNGMLVISGETYTTRLWCILEMFVYISMRDVDEQQAPDVKVLDETVTEQAVVRRKWLTFDAHHCNCFNATDKERILAVIGASDGAVLGFNKKMKAIAADVFATPHEAALEDEEVLFTIGWL